MFLLMSKFGLDPYLEFCLQFQLLPILIPSTNGKLMSMFWFMYKDTNTTMSVFFIDVDVDVLINVQ